MSVDPSVSFEARVITTPWLVSRVATSTKLVVVCCGADNFHRRNTVAECRDLPGAILRERIEELSIVYFNERSIELPF